MKEKNNFGPHISIGLIAFVKSVYYNLRYLPFRQAMHLPVLVGRNTRLQIRGRIKITAKKSFSRTLLC
jgi:hypothetical protein